MSAAITRNDLLGRYETPVDGGMAIAVFQQEGDVLLFTHTEVPRGAQGRGAASALIAGALEDVRERGLKVRPLCSFVRRYMENHPRPGTSSPPEELQPARMAVSIA